MAEVLLSSSATVSSSSLGGNQATAPRNNRTQVGEQVGCSYEPLTSWMDKYLNGGLSELVRPSRHQKPSRLSVEQQQQLKAMVLTQRPTDYGIERQMWTGAILCEVIAQRNYELSPALFEILTLKEDWGKLKYHQSQSDSKVVSLMQLQQALGLPLIEVWLLFTAWKTEQYKWELRENFYTAISLQSTNTFAAHPI